MRRLAALVLITACNVVDDNQPPGTLHPEYSGVVRDIATDESGLATASFFVEDLTVTGTVAFRRAGCALGFRVRAERDGRYLGGTLTSSSATLAFSASTLLDRIVGSYEATSGAPCTGSEASFDFKKSNP